MLVFKKHYFWRRITSLMFLILTSLGIRHWIQTLLDGMSSCGVDLDDLNECHEYSADDSSNVQRSHTLIQDTTIIKNGFRVIKKKTYCSQHAIFSGFYKIFTDVCYRSIYRFYLLHPRIQISQNLMKTVKYRMLQTKYSLKINRKLFRNIQ